MGVVVETFSRALALLCALCVSAHTDSICVLCVVCIFCTRELVCVCVYVSERTSVSEHSVRSFMFCMRYVCAMRCDACVCCMDDVKM